MHIITWNIRGLESDKKKRFLSKLIKKRKPDIIFVQETKLENVERIVVQRLWARGDFEFACSNLERASGGLLTIWNRDFFRVENFILHRSFILLEGGC